MICEQCQGTGRLIPGAPEVCSLCQGSGIAYCCDEAGSNSPNDWSADDANRARLEQRQRVPEEVGEDGLAGGHVRSDKREMARIRDEVMHRFSVTLDTLAKR